MRCPASSECVAMIAQCRAKTERGYRVGVEQAGVRGVQPVVQPRVQMMNVVVPDIAGEPAQGRLESDALCLQFPTCEGQTV